MIDLRKLVELSDKSLGGNPPIISLVFAMLCGYWFPSVFNSIRNRSQEEPRIASDCATL